MDSSERNAAAPRPVWARVLRAILVVLLPVVLALTNVRLLMTRAFLEVEYRMPGFPEDPFGFSREDRLHWAPIALDYLLNHEGTAFLGDLRFEDGAPVYNVRELRHMDDVKRVAQAALKVWEGGLVFAAAVLAFLFLARKGREAWRALSIGSALAFVLMLALAVGLVVGFSVVFVGFHRVFFQGDTWLFLYSDTLIRLFPERFWQDAFVFIALATLAEAGAIYLGARRWGRALEAKGSSTE
jgi:integral membrane protein (TIGR01906 family)